MFFFQASQCTDKNNNKNSTEITTNTFQLLLLACDAPLEVDFQQDWHLVLTVWYPLASHNCHIAFYDGQLATEEGSAGSILLVEEQPCLAMPSTGILLAPLLWPKDARNGQGWPSQAALFAAVAKTCLCCLQFRPSWASICVLPQDIVGINPTQASVRICTFRMSTI